MKKLGIIGAMTVEVESLKQQLQHRTESRRAGMTFYEGQLEGCEVVVVMCGVGKVNAALCVQVLCDCYGVTHLVNTGVAGSLCAELDIGDLVISQDAMYHDFTCHALNPDYVVGQVPGLPVLRFTAEKAISGAFFNQRSTGRLAKYCALSSLLPRVIKKGPGNSENGYC
jgi:adenosylhomocysteine nucleosidase